MATEEAVYCPHCGAAGQSGTYCMECGEAIRDATEQTGDAGDDVQEAQEPDRPEEPGSTEGEETEPLEESEEELITGQRLIIAGAVLAAIGAFLPWFSASALGTTVEVTGVERDGKFTLAFAVIAGLAGWRYGDRPWSRWVVVGVVVLGGLTAFFGGVYIYDPWIGQEAPRQEVQNAVQIEMGLYATLIGGALMAIGPIYDRSQGDSGSILPAFVVEHQKAIGVAIGLLVGLAVVNLMSG